MVCVPARAGSDKFLPASSHPLEERACLVGLWLSHVAATFLKKRNVRCLLFSHLAVVEGTEGLTVGTCFGSIEIRTISLQAYMEVFTAGPETSPERQARRPKMALLRDRGRRHSRVRQVSVPPPNPDPWTLGPRLISLPASEHP